jgi:hypothetical protein
VSIKPSAINLNIMIKEASDMIYIKGRTLILNKYYAVKILSLYFAVLPLTTHIRMEDTNHE